MARIACLFVPLFPLAARLRSEPELAGEAVVVCEGNGAAARIVGASKVARNAGLMIGMSLAQSRSMLPNLIARGRDPHCEHSAHQTLLEIGSSLSPRVEDASEDLVFADISGMERLFENKGGEEEIGRAAMLLAEGLGLFMRVGIAANKLAARIGACTPPSPTVIPPGKEACFLAPLPLHHLDLDRRLADTLCRWGVTSIGNLARLPADRVASRLGPAGRAAHLAARGIDSQPLIPHHPPPTITEAVELEWAVVTVEPLLYALGQALERVRTRLEREDLGCAQLELQLGLEDEATDQRTIRLPAPTREIDVLLSLARLELDARPPAAPVTSFRCIAHPDRPRRGQLTLFGAPEVDPDTLASTLARLASRLGPNQIGSPRTVDGHLPERFTNVAFHPPPPPKIRQPPQQGRGLLAIRVLRPPVELEVITEERGADPKEQPMQKPTSKPGKHTTLRLRSVASIPGATPRIQGLVRVAAGPWRLEDGWWSDAPIERNYWDVELSGGGLYRIFCDQTGEWYADGMYD